MSYGKTGFVLKNDIYAHGNVVSKEGVVKSKKCMICHKEINAIEIVYYVFSARGTQSASSMYVHTECEPQCRIPIPIRQSKSHCKTCNGSQNIDGCFLLPNRNIYYHQSCLPQTPCEVVPEAELEERLKKRAEGRLKRGEVYYTISLKPYVGLDFLATNRRYPASEVNLFLTIRPFDGRLSSVSVGYCIFFSGGGWRPVRNAELDLSYFKFDPKKREECIATILQAVRDLRKHYNARGRPIGERLDADIHLRFLLKHGHTMEQMVNEPKR